jgi:hypothetical protein
MRSRTDFGTELNLLLAGCSVISAPEKLDRIRHLLGKPIDWASLLKSADQHGVTFLLHQELSEVGNPLPAREVSKLQKRYRTNLHRSMFFTRELIRIFECLEALSIDVLPYKGVILAETVYRDIALRQSGDIDLFIRTKDFSRICEAVRGLGYTPHLALSPMEEQAYLRSGYECAFDSPDGRNLLEVQWALQPHFYAVDMDMEGLFQRSVPVAMAGRSMKTLSPEDLLIVLSLHATKHAWGRLIWLCDIARILGQSNLRWEWIEQQASALGIVRILRVTLLLAHRLLNAPIPFSIEAKVVSDPVSLSVVEEIISQIATGTACDVESFSYFRLMLRLRERPSDQMRFLSRLALTPGPGEWNAVRLPPALFPLYRIIRLSRLAARFARA